MKAGSMMQPERRVRGQDALARLTRQASLAWVAGVYAVYGLIHAAIAAIAGPALALDDVKLNVEAQSFEWGYQPSNPPLYEWILVAVQQLAGPTLASFLLVKYALLVAAGSFAYLAAKELFADRRWAALTALSFLATYQIGWNYHQAFTHTTALIAATAFLWWSVLRLMRTRSPADFALFGAALGLGLLAKYSFAGAAAALFAAMAARASTRRVLLDPRMGLALGVAALIVAPHAFWLLDHESAVAAEAASRVGAADADRLQRAIEGVPATAWAIVAFFLPLSAILLGCYGARRDWLAAPPEGAMLARDATLIGGAGLFAAVIALGMDGLQERYVIAFMLPGVFFLLAAARAFVAPPGRAAALALAIFGVAAAIVAARSVEALRPGPPFCDACRQYIPYEALSAALTGAGFDGSGTLVGYDDHTAGNLRRLFPRARALSAHMPHYAPPGGDDTEPCYFAWSLDLSEAPPEYVLEALADADRLQVSAMTRPLAGTPRPVSWTVATVEPGSPLRAALCRPRQSEK